MVLEDTGVGKVVGRADAEAVEIARTGVADAKTREELAAKKIQVDVSGRELLGGVGASELTDETDSLLPSGVGSEADCVVEGNDLAAGMEGLWEPENLTDSERTRRGIVLEIVFSGEAILGAE